MFNWQSVYKQTFQGTCLQLFIQLTMGGNPGEGHIPAMFWEMGDNPPMFCNQTAASRQLILPMLKPSPADFKPHRAMKRPANGLIEASLFGTDEAAVAGVRSPTRSAPDVTVHRAHCWSLACASANKLCVCVPCFDSDFRRSSSQPIT